MTPDEKEMQDRKIALMKKAAIAAIVFGSVIVVELGYIGAVLNYLAFH